jgi:predicted nuclease of restriction endonuclease-like (RecB) superfamily
LLYINYPISQTLSDQLSWSHYCEILSIEDDIERSFYEKQSVIERWLVRELRRQKDTALFQRLALSKSKEEVWALAKQGYVPKQPKEIVKDPYIFEFLGMGEKDLKKESQLEERLIDNLQSFLMELGKGFTFRAVVRVITDDYLSYAVLSESLGQRQKIRVAKLYGKRRTVGSK